MMWLSSAVAVDVEEEWERALARRVLTTDFL